MAWHFMAAGTSFTPRWPNPPRRPAYWMISMLSRARDQFSDYWRSWQLSGHEQGA
jgi:hypothetical protein